MEARSPSQPLPEADQDQLDHLKRQPEWESIINMFAADKYQLQDMMLGDVTSAERDRMAAKAEMAEMYLTKALEKPKDEEI